jgi:hypothetical protein
MDLDIMTKIRFDCVVNWSAKENINQLQLLTRTV